MILFSHKSQKGHGLSVKQKCFTRYVRANLRSCKTTKFYELDFYLGSAEREQLQPKYNINLDSDLSSLQLPWSSGETESFEKMEEAEEDFGEFAAAKPVSVEIHHFHNIHCHLEIQSDV